MYSSTLSLTSALDRAGCQRHSPATLPPGKTRYPFYRRLGGSQGRSGPARKISSPPGFDPLTVQPVATPVINYKHNYDGNVIQRRTQWNRRRYQTPDIPHVPDKLCPTNDTLPNCDKVHTAVKTRYSTFET